MAARHFTGTMNEHLDRSGETVRKEISQKDRKQNQCGSYQHHIFTQRYNFGLNSDFINQEWNGNDFHSTISIAFRLEMFHVMHAPRDIQKFQSADLPFTDAVKLAF